MIPEKLVGMDIYENNLYELSIEIQSTHPELKFVPVIASIRYRESLSRVFEEYRPDVVFHAAAHKHVPLMESNPQEALLNNIVGTKNVIDLSDEWGVEKFILISTDKAVNPTNVMGATKRVAEMLMQDKSHKSRTSYSAVRFGNVLGSNGSVVPLFQKQIDKGACNGDPSRGYALFYDDPRSGAACDSDRCHGGGRRDLRVGYG